MGTRSETIVWDGRGMVVLYKHWDGYPDYMITVFEEVADFAAFMAVDQIHWLSYAEDVAAYIITYYGMLSKEERNRFGWPQNPDFRPCGRIADWVDYVYLLDVSKAEKGEWVLKIYEVKPEFWRLSREERDAIYREMVEKGVSYDNYLSQIGVEKIPVKAMRAKPGIKALATGLEKGY
jgi:hypothetical protein